ncbi:TonB-dependent receptor [Methylopila jiangsuensis]|uniref:TonB-dependent receptor n=1 Tax=Methylopila jiangsuensis TaxID=586230 RepID=A0A9W6N365_9HYPH|nr:TonB-dependent receptor [Methylopila jiangsuensis]MDR6286212.1 iron complex outermembrane receptor protein [Methylopila jiangsuensis]GLK75973.1 TonB-dependent receptor [Methylopila jiangsuensis]
MSRLCARSALLSATALAAGAFVLAPRASAQSIELPEIEVTSPSPVRRAPAQPAAAAATPTGALPVVTDVFAPVTVVTRDEIARAQPLTLGEALRDKPGLTGSSFAPGADRPIIRGLEGPRVRIIENGLGVHDVSALGEDHAVPVNPLVADQIEVIRGPATLRYGSSAIGGVVSVENSRIPRTAPEGGYSGEAIAGFSTVGRGRSAAARFDAGHNGFLFHADGFATKSGAYDTPDGRQANSEARSTGGGVGFSKTFEQGYVGLSYSHYDSLYRIPGGESAELNSRLDPKQDKLQAQGEYRFEDGPFAAVRFWVNASRYKHRELGLEEDHDHGHEDEGHGHDHDHDHDHEDEHEEARADVVHGVFRNRETEARVELQHAPATFSFGSLTGAFGVQAGRGKLKTSGEGDGLIAPTDSTTVAAYVFEQIDFGRGLKLQGAGRIEHASADGVSTTYPGLVPDGTDPIDRDRKRAFTPISGSLGLLQDLPNGFVASLTGQYVERAPSGLELFSRGSHHAAGLFEIGDPNLKLETAKSVEIGLRRSEGALRLDASAYHTWFDGFIYRRLTGVGCGHAFESCGEEDEFDQSVYSQKNAKFYGVELAAQFDAVTVGQNTFGVEGQYDFTRAKFTDGANVPRIPPHRLGGGVFWRSETGFFARVNLLHAFAQTKFADHETRTPGYDNLKAELSYTKRFPDALPGRVSTLTVGLLGDNLLNDRIRNAASFKKDEILLPGAGARLFVKVGF